MMVAERRYIGKLAQRVDAADKVTGRARFVADYRVPDMLYARCLRSELPHARIARLDETPALAMPGAVGEIARASLRERVSG
jgi:CO/xanthine dehydrogenase Mo-binding subunit